MELVCDDPNLTPAAGLVTVAELDRVLGMVETIDEAVGPLARPGARGKPYSAGEVVVSFAEPQLAGGDFMVDLDTRRAGTAGAELRAVKMPPASTTIAYLAQRFGGKGVVRLGRAAAELARRSFYILPEEEQARLASLRPTLDVDPTEVECYGKKRAGFACNYQGQWAGAELPGGVGRGRPGARGQVATRQPGPPPPARRLIKKAVAALPDGLGPPRSRFDSGFFDGKLAKVRCETNL